MSDEKRPFAVVTDQPPWRTDNDGWSTLQVGGVAVFGPTHEFTRVGLQQLADPINAAVEQREARLVGALQAVVHLDDTAFGNTEPWTSFARVAAACRAALDGAGPEYVSGDVACAMAFDMGAAQWTQHVLQRLVEALDVGGITREWMEAMGMRAATHSHRSKPHSERSWCGERGVPMAADGQPHSCPRCSHEMVGAMGRKDEILLMGSTPQQSVLVQNISYDDE